MMEKMTFRLIKTEDGYPPDDLETLWVERLERQSYRIENIPFYIRDVSPGDVVRGKRSDGVLWFDGILERSDSSVIRIIIFVSSKSDDLLRKLVSFGCKWEGSHLSSLYSVEVPGTADYASVLGFLQEQVDDGALDFEEASLRFR